MDGRLQDYCRRNNVTTPYASLPQHEYQQEFLHWVADIRSKSLHASSKENLTCPILLCRQGFTDFNLLLRHISTCPKLSSAIYWCHHCHRPERFLGSRGSRLRRSVRSIFKHLRRKSSYKDTASEMDNTALPLYHLTAPYNDTVNETQYGITTCRVRRIFL